MALSTLLQSSKPPHCSIAHLSIQLAFGFHFQRKLIKLLDWTPCMVILHNDQMLGAAYAYILLKNLSDLAANISEGAFICHDFVLTATRFC